MNKKVVLLFLSMFFLISVFPGRGEANIQDKKVKEVLLALGIIDMDDGDVEEVSRLQCITMLDKAIGITEEIVERDRKAFYERPFKDVDSPYASLAHSIGVAVGERIVEYVYDGEEYGTYYFYPNRSVSTKEVCAFLVRCLEIPEYDIDTTFAKAKEFGLVNETDWFYCNSDEPIDFDSICIIFYRFLYQPRYMYFTGEFSPRHAIDNERSMTYLEYLKLKETEN